jgi:hypothetical protein
MGSGGGGGGGGRELPPIEPNLLFEYICRGPSPCGEAMRTIAPNTPPNAYPGRAAGGPRRGLVPQAQTVQTCVKCWSARSDSMADNSNSSKVYRREGYLPCTEKA